MGVTRDSRVTEKMPATGATPCPERSRGGPLSLLKIRDGDRHVTEMPFTGLSGSSRRCVKPTAPTSRPGIGGDKKLGDVLHILDEPSLSHLVRDLHR